MKTTEVTNILLIIANVQLFLLWIGIRPSPEPLPAPTGAYRALRADVTGPARGSAVDSRT